MKIYNEIGSKERFLELFQGVNKIKLNEVFDQFNVISVLQSEYNALSNGDIRVERSNTRVNGNLTNIDLECRDNQGNKITFTFEVESEMGDQEGVSNVGNISLNKFTFQGKDGSSNIQIDKNNLSEFNNQFKDSFYNVIQDYIDVQEERPMDEEFSNIAKKIDSFPYGGGSTQFQTGKSYANMKPTNAELRVDAPELNKYVDESTDQDRYENVVFMQGEEANKPFEILNNQGKDAAMEYLKNWHTPGQHMGSSELGHGSKDLTYEKDGYIMSWNPYIGYIGLDYDLSNMDESIGEIDSIVNQELNRFKQQTQPIVKSPQVDITPDFVIPNEKRELILQAYNNLIKKGIPAPTTNQVHVEIQRMSPTQKTNINTRSGEYPEYMEENSFSTNPDAEMGSPVEFARMNTNLNVNSDGNPMVDELLGFKPMNVGDNIEEEYYDFQGEKDFDTQDSYKKYLFYKQKDWDSLTPEEKEEYFQVWLQFKGA